MSSFGAFGGGTPAFGTTGPGSYQQQPNNPFGQYTDLVMDQQGPGGGPQGYNYNAQTGMYQMYVPGSTGNPFGGVTYQTTGSAPSGPGGMAQMAGGAMGDYMDLVNANNMNYANIMGAGNQFQQAVASGAEDIRMSGQQAQDDLYGFASAVQDRGQQIYGDIGGRVDEAIGGFQDLSAQQASSISAGLARQQKSQQQQIHAAAKMGDPNALAAQQQMAFDADVARAQTMTQQAANYNQGLAGLRMQGAQAMTGAGGIVQGMESIAANLNQMGASIYQGAMASAAQFEAQGFSEYANFIASNPYSPVAFLPTLTSFFQFTQTPGSSEFAGLPSELLMA